MSLSTFFEMLPFFQSSSNVSFSLSFECLSPFPWYISIPLFILWFSRCLSSSIWNDFQLISSERLSLFQGCPFPPLSLYKMSLFPSPQNDSLSLRNVPPLSLLIESSLPISSEYINLSQECPFPPLSLSLGNVSLLFSSECLSLCQEGPLPHLSLFEMSLLPSPQNVCLFHRNFPSLSLSISGMSLFILIRMSLFLSPHAECISLSHSL